MVQDRHPQFSLLVETRTGVVHHQPVHNSPVLPPLGLDPVGHKLGEQLASHFGCLDVLRRMFGKRKRSSRVILPSPHIVLGTTRIARAARNNFGTVVGLTESGPERRHMCAI